MGKEATFLDFLRFVAGRLKPFRRTIIICACLSLLAAGLATLGPILMGRGFDLAGKHRPFLWYGGALAAWWLLSLLAETLRVYVGTVGSNIAERVALDDLVESLLKLMDKPLSYHYGSKISETEENLGNFRWRLENFIEGPIFDMAPSLLTEIFILTYLFILDWRTGAILTAAVVILVGYSYPASRRRIRLQAELNKFMTKTWADGWDAMKNILVVKSTTNERLIGEKLRQEGGQYYRAMAAYNRFERRMNLTLSVITGTGMFGALVIGAARFSAGALTFGQLAAVTAYSFTVFGYVRWMHWTFSQSIRVMGKYRDVQPELQTPAEDFTSGEAVEINGGVEFRGVRFRYREDKPALEDVSFRVKPGERVAVVGESGEGKTTLVDLIGRYYVPQAGQVLLDGRPIGGINLRCLRRQLAYVPQDLTLFNDTIAFNIRFGRPEASDEEVRRAARQANIDGFIASLPEGYDTRVGERGLKLSGGERQRVALARAFLRDPAILILDEPTSNLDSMTEEHIRASLTELMRDRTTFIVAHRLRTVKEADRILVLKHGRIVEEGTHDELSRRPDGAYAEMLRAQGAWDIHDGAARGEHCN